jgi:class 3 adenylate cyclase
VKKNNVAQAADGEWQTNVRALPNRLAHGPVFAAEIGEPRGRREYNVLGDTVNTAARLMARSEGSQVLLTEAVYRDIAHRFANCRARFLSRAKPRRHPPTICRAEKNSGNHIAMLLQAFRKRTKAKAMLCF